MADLEKEQLRIREEVSNMSFEELQKLQEKLGRRIYNEKILNVKKKPRSNGEFKRTNKHGPLEMSSKIRPRKLNSIGKPKMIRDPRFDPLCGEFDNKKFNKSYKFIDEIKKKEYQTLKKELKDTEDPKKIAKIKYLMQRMENQSREKERKEKEEAQLEEEREENVTALKEGRRPRYQRKPEKKLKKIVEQYEELKESGKLKKYIEKKRKSNSRKDFFKISDQ